MTERERERDGERKIGDRCISRQGERKRKGERDRDRERESGRERERKRLVPEGHVPKVLFPK